MNGVDHLRRECPEIPLRHWDEAGDDADVTYALFEPAAGRISGASRTSSISSARAGVDALLDDPDLPAGVPVVRMVEEASVIGMTEYVAPHPAPAPPPAGTRSATALAQLASDRDALGTRATRRSDGSRRPWQRCGDSVDGALVDVASREFPNAERDAGVSGYHMPTAWTISSRGPRS